jgi:hypothetical protein
LTDYLGWDNSVLIPLDIRTNNDAHPQPINFYTKNGFPRMQIFDSLGMPNGGNVAIGYFSVLTNGPQSLLHLDQQDTLPNCIQFTNNSTGNTTSKEGFQVGIPEWYGTKAELRQWYDDKMDFYTNNSVVGTTRMTIMGGDASTGGYVGISTDPPAHQLDVKNDININNPRQYYMINSETVLSNPLNFNILVGVHAGENVLTSQKCAIVGYSAGQQLKVGDDNTFMGYQSGLLTNSHSITDSASHNCFFGDASGRQNTNGFQNTFVGAHCGGTTSGKDNVCAP